MLSMDMFTSEKGSAMADTKQSSETEKESIFVRPTPSSLSSKDPHKWYGTLSTFPGKGSSELIKQASTAGGSRFLQEISESMCTGVRAAKKRSATEESRPYLEELTDAEVMQLTREDCRRYLKERGMRCPSWNKSQAIQQVLFLKGLYDSKGPDEIKVPKEDGLPKDCTEVTSDNAIPSLLKKIDSNGLLNQGAFGGMKEVHTFFGSGKEGFVLPTSQRKGLPDDDQPQLPPCMDENLEPPCPSHAFASSLINSDFTLSLPPREKGPLLTDYGGFGSPLPLFLASNCLQGPMFSAVQNTAARNAQEQRPTQGTQTFSESGIRCRASSAYLRQPTSQLTMFYAGFVNVFDNVPADKAQAIMLLAGSGKQWASYTGHPSTSTDYPVSVPASIPEVPQARKASLQRFFQKLKERALVKAPDIAKNSDNAHSSSHLAPARDTSRCSSKALQDGSATPVLLPAPCQSAAPTNQPWKSCGTENFSPCGVPRKETVLNCDEEMQNIILKMEKISETSETVHAADRELTENEDTAS